MKTGNPFIDEARDFASRTTTENGAIAYRTTSNPLVDLFGVIGALRKDVTTGSVHRLHTLIDGAYLEDKTLLAKMLFYSRDIRGGLGERDTFREAIRYCAGKYPEIVKDNIIQIPEYGRWDDMFALVGTPLEDDMWGYMKRVYEQDLYTINEGSKSISLLAKWLPSADASSENTRRKGCYAAKRLSTSVYNYKREVKALRRVIDTIESHISAKDWGTYDYSKVPSNAMLKYNSAFTRNDAERFYQYLSNVSSGKAKINSATLYPYDLVRKVMNTRDVSILSTCEGLWKNLPNYVEGENNYLVMADVSGSMMAMNGLPMYSSIGLAIYFAERNKGPFKGLFMTFSEKPHFVDLPKHYSFKDKCKYVAGSDWGGNTDLEAAFDQILKVAIQSKSTQKELPKSLIIITDMEFDEAVGRADVSFFDAMKDKFANAGYEMPNVVFWNVCSRHETYHAKADAPNVQLVSGQSTSTFKNLIEGLGKTPYEMMVQTLSNKRYDPITVSSQ